MAAGTDYATKSDMRALDRKLDATQGDVRALDKKLDATQADVRALDKKLDATRHDLTALVESTRDGLDAKINRVGVFLERLEAKVDSIIEALPAKASATDTEVARLRKTASRK